MTLKEIALVQQNIECHFRNCGGLQTIVRPVIGRNRAYLWLLFIITPVFDRPLPV